MRAAQTACARAGATAGRIVRSDQDPGGEAPARRRAGLADEALTEHGLVRKLVHRHLERDLTQVHVLGAVGTGVLT
jgi:hypothetical protein